MYTPYTKLDPEAMARSGARLAHRAHRDSLTELPQGSRQLAAPAVEAECATFLATYDTALTDQARRQIVRNICLPGTDAQAGGASALVSFRVVATDRRPSPQPGVSAV